MIIVDTNVVSEVIKPAPAKAVLHWLSLQDRREVYTTAITQAEVLYGVEAMPPGKRRDRLHAEIEALFDTEFVRRVLPFDAEAARWYPKIVAGRSAIGRPISQFDGVIASICRSRSAVLATRDTSDFQHCGIAIINPWL